MTLPYGQAKLEIVGEQQMISMIPGQGMHSTHIFNFGLYEWVAAGCLQKILSFESY